MRNVTRTAKPGSLKRNATRWKKQLLDEIKKCKPGETVEDKHFDRYRNDDVKAALKTMYGERCCYCEVNITNITWEHIEHRKPKAIGLFPNLTFTWSNLHLACPKCNNAKSDQWDNANPILDAVKDAINDHLTYELSGVGLLRWHKSSRGDTTIIHADLDRENLPITRLKLFAKLLKAIEGLNSALGEGVDILDLRAKARKLNLESRDDFGSVVSWTIEKYLDDDLKP